ncbi:restriction endonuclease subunit S [Marinobacter bohaiensis]|uniref:restriction endonuclease subunit S n=1 Tax=Marinobacter bohaiensis TaxID=2201898 RepID=UPI0019550589|nr:restriction endonuclease subunit S [Marinobacter bohaiensis]
MLSIAEFPKYEAYKDSKMTWVSEFPESWRIEKGKWLFSRAERPVRSEDEIVTCFRDGVVTLRKNRRTEGFTNAMKEHGYQGIRKGDLVIHAMDAFAGAIGVSDSDGKSTPVYAACVPRNKGEVLPEFYAYFLRDMALSGFVASLAKGIRERSTDFRFNDFANLDLPVPLFEEQRIIAKFLDKKTTQIDEAIAIKEQQIALLKERKQIIIQKTVTQGLDPNVPMKDSGVDWVGEIPAHWEVRRGKYIFKKESRPVRGCDEVVTCFRDGQVTLRSNRRSDGFTFAIKEHGYQGVRKGDLVIHAMDAFAGAIGVSDSDGKSSPVYAVCRPFDRAQVNSKYYALYLRNLALNGFIESLAKGIRERSTDFRFKDFSELFLPVPDLLTQDQVVEEIEKNHAVIDAAISELLKQIIKVVEYRSTLINSAVTGKIRITPDMVEA